MTTTCGCSTATCGCCEGVSILTPLPETNRPGLPAIRYRVGTHGAFFETMKARLGTMTVETPGADGQGSALVRPLVGLTTRDPADFSIALLDGWALVAEVLTFYQERIANEGYLRTATELRSLLELARLLGYDLRPGVAATVYLSYLIDDNQTTPVTIPAGTAAQSVPVQPGEQAQTFETTDPLIARKAWNNLPPRMVQPQQITFQNATAIDQGTLYLKGTALNLKANDALLFHGKETGQNTVAHVATAEADFTNQWTKVTLQKAGPDAEEAVAREAVTAPAPPREGTDAFGTLGKLIAPLSLAPASHPRSSAFLARSLADTVNPGRDTLPQVVTVLKPEVASTIYRAWAKVPPAATPNPQIFALRVRAQPFAASVAFPILPGAAPAVAATPAPGAATIEAVALPTPLDRIALDTQYNQILLNSFVAIAHPGLDNPAVFRVKALQNASESFHGVTGKSTLLTLDRAWLSNYDEYNEIFRQTTVYAQSEELTLAPMPYGSATTGKLPEVSGATIPLGALYDGLTSGRWAIVSGERTDIIDAAGKTVPGVTACELVMISGVQQGPDPNVPGDGVLSTLLLAKPLAYRYKRDTVAIYGNVVKATHGATQNETLGSGDGTQTFQSFQLKQSPLTFVAAPTAAGVASTLQVYVNNLQWQETDTLADLGPADRAFITRRDEQANATVIFGDGQHGALLPTGTINAVARYRSGIGQPGNVNAGQITVPQTRVLGVRSVNNYLPATGGADAEDVDQARANAPLAVASLDRLVSLSDYANFTRTFAGIGKAAAARLSDGRRQFVQITVAGVDDIPIDVSSDLYQNLLLALQEFGDPALPLQVDARELIVLVLGASIQLSPGYQWESVSAAVRAALLDQFGFARRELAEPACLCDVIATIQNTPGVFYVRVDGLGGVGLAASPSTAAQSVAASPAHYDAQGVFHPAQLAIFTLDVPDTIILNQLT